MAEEDEDVFSLEGLDDDSSDETSDELNDLGKASEKKNLESSSDVATHLNDGDGDSKKAEGSVFDHYLASTHQADEFLAEEDAEFLKSLKSLEDIEAGDAEISSEPLDPDLLKDDKKVISLGAIKKLDRLFAPYYWLKYVFEFVFFRFKKWKVDLVQWFQWLKGEGLKRGIEKVKAAFVIVSSYLKKSWLWFKQLTWKRKALLFSLAGVVVFLMMHFKTLLLGKFLPHKTSQTVASFSVEADRIFLIDSSRGYEGFDSPLRHSENIVLLKQIVANLLSVPEKNQYPMGLFKIFLKGSTQAVAVEIKDREAELIDIFQRLVESTPYDVLDTTHGKEGLKKRFRREADRVLNKGQIQSVYFHLISLKP